MDKETYKKLTKDFPKSVVKKAPPGKFGDYVPHHIYTQRLVDVIPGKYNFKYEALRDKDGALAGAKCILEIDGLGTIEEVGDVDSNQLKNNNTESELLKLAVSDGIKRCCMRFGIGLELWTGGVTEEEHYAVQQPVKKTGTVKDVVIEKEDKALAEAKKEFVKEVEDNPNNKQQLDHTVSAMIPDEKVRKKIMNDTYKNVTETQGFPTKISEWNNEQMNTYITMIEVVSEDTSDIEKILGEFKDITQNCPECGKSEWIEDNRKKKQDDPGKFGKIPSWSCNNYGDKEGCGWTGWGDTDCPTEWL
jgi:hypothetical protein